MCNCLTLAYEFNISYEKTKLNLMNTVHGCTAALNFIPSCWLWLFPKYWFMKWNVSWILKYIHNYFDLVHYIKFWITKIFFLCITLFHKIFPNYGRIEVLKSLICYYMNLAQLHLIMVMLSMAITPKRSIYYHFVGSMLLK